MNSSDFLESLRQLFIECDVNKLGSLGDQEFSIMCSKIGLSKEAARETFERLDSDKNGRITFDEFKAGFNQYSKQTAAPSSGGKATSPSAKSGHQQHQQQQQPLAATGGAASSRLSPVQARARKTSPVGSLLPLGSASRPSGSQLNQVSSTSSSGGDAYPSSRLSYSTDEQPVALIGSASSSSFSELPAHRNDDSGVVVFSSDMIPADTGHQYHSHGALDGALYNANNNNNSYSSGQFGGTSLLSNGSQTNQYNQVRTMQDLLECVQKLQNENQILSQIFFKDKREREEYISQLGEEFDQQVREVEERANRRAREEMEAEKKRLREMMQTERETLQHHYKTIERMSNLIKTSDGKQLKAGGSSGTIGEDATIDKVKSQLDDTYLENRQLKKSLLDTKTDVAMIWKEMEGLKQKYEEKLTNAYEHNQQTKEECDHIKQQLTLMKDSNRKLQDASDVITTYITDKVEPVIKIATGDDVDPDAPFSSLTGSHRVASRASSRRGSILSEYLNNNNNTSDDLDDTGQAVGHREPTMAPPPLRPNLLTVDTAASDLATHRARSKSASLQSPHKVPPRRAPPPTPPPVPPAKRQTDLESPLSKSPKTGATSSDNELASKPEATDDSHHPSPTAASAAPTTAKSSRRGFGLHFFGSRTQSEADTSIDLTPESRDLAENTTGKTSKQAETELPTIEPVDGPSVASYDIMLVGDSFVGKSSLANRFVEGHYVKDTISTTSIDFRKRDCKVDGKNYTINIWDTA